MKRYSVGLVCIAIAISALSCRKEKKVIYDLVEIEAGPDNAYKDKQKTEEQYVAILYANLFQKALAANELVEITDLIYSVGDKEVIHEIIISNFMNDPGVQFPSDAEMRSDIDAFIIDTYKRFLVRTPLEIEKSWFKSFILANENVTPELVYFAFSICNEYYFY